MEHSKAPGEERKLIKLCEVGLAAKRESGKRAEDAEAP